MIPNPFRHQIAQLVAANIATHIVDNKQSVDALYALSKARDFPQVRFAAAFGDGIVVIGCDDDLPDQLVEIAQKVTATDDMFADLLQSIPAKSDIGTGSLVQKIDGLSTQIEQMASLTDDSDLENRIDRLEAVIRSSRNDIIAAQTAQPASDDLSAQLSDIRQRLENGPDLQNLLDPIATQQTELMQLLTATGRAVDISDISNLFDVFQANMRSAFTPLQDLPQQTGQMIETQKNVENHLALIEDRLDALFSFAQPDTENDPTKQISNKIDQLINILQDASHASPVFDCICEMQHHIVTQIDDLATRPLPKIDLTEQRQTIARFQTAMAATLVRLEESVAKLDHPSNTEPTAARALAQFQAELSEQMTQINDAICALHDRPVPAIDLTEQRRSLSSYADVLNASIKRWENVVRAQADNTAMPAIQTQLAEVKELLGAIDSASSGHLITEFLGKNAEALTALHDKISDVANRPEPVLDLTAQRASHAQFATAMAAVVKRLEAATEKVSAAPDEGTGVTHIAVDISAQSQEDRPANADTIIFQRPEDQGIEQAKCLKSATGLEPATLALLRTNLAELIASQIMERSMTKK